MPDEIRKDLKVNYQIGDEIVHTEIVKERRQLQVDYVYETVDHLRYCEEWKDENGERVYKGKFVLSDMTLSGYSLPNISSTTSEGDEYTKLNTLFHVPSDGKVVIADKYKEKEIVMGDFLIFARTDVEEIYLPKTLHEIGVGNFAGCVCLKTIYYAGNEEEWNNITKAVELPTGVELVFNTSFVVS